MHITLIALILIAFLGGMLSKCATGHKNPGGSFLNLIRFKSNEEIHKEQLNQYLGKYLKNKDSLLGDLQQEIGPLSKAVKDASDKDSSFDLLRLKNLMAQFEDQNLLMVQDGKEILAFNEKQKKINQEMATKTNVDMFLSRSNQRELMDRQKDTLAQMRNNPAARNNPQIAERLNAVYEKTLSRLDTLRQQQDQLENMKQSSFKSSSSVKEKLEEQKRRMDDQMRSNNDRMKDQMERLKDRNRR